MVDVLNLMKQDLLLVTQGGIEDADLALLLANQQKGNKLLDEFLYGRISFGDYLAGLDSLGVDIDDYADVIIENMGLEL